MEELDEITENKKNSFLDLAHKKFGNNHNAEIKALEEALEQWITQEMEKREFWNLLEDLKNSDNYKIRSRAAFRLGKYNNKQAVNALIKTVDKDEDGDVKRKAAASLGKIGNEKAIEQLIHLFDNNDKIIRAHALNYLGDMGNLAVGPLLEYCNSKNEKIKAGCIAALGRIASQYQINAILDVLSSALIDEQDIVKWRAAAAFSAIGVQHVIANKNLIALLGDDSLRVRQNALEALGYMGTGDALSYIIRSKQDEDLNIRNSADKALKEIERRVNERKL